MEQLILFATSDEFFFLSRKLQICFSDNCCYNKKNAVNLRVNQVWWNDITFFPIKNFLFGLRFPVSRFHMRRVTIDFGHMTSELESHSLYYLFCLWYPVRWISYIKITSDLFSKLNFENNHYNRITDFIVWEVNRVKMEWCHYFQIKLGFLHVYIHKKVLFRFRIAAAWLNLKIIWNFLNMTKQNK